MNTSPNVNDISFGKTRRTGSLLVLITMVYLLLMVSMGITWYADHQRLAGEVETWRNTSKTLEASYAALDRERDSFMLSAIDSAFARTLTGAGADVTFSVTAISLPASDTISDSEFVRLKELKELRRMKLSGNSFSDAIIDRVVGLPLESLSLCETRVTDLGIAGIATMRLREFALEGGAVTDAGLRFVAEMQDLVSLDVQHLPITDAGLVWIQELRNLRSLRLGNTNVTNAGLARLARLADLQNLVLDSTQINGAGLKHLTGLSNLRWLHLSKTQVREEDIEVLKKLNSLEMIELSGTAISPPAIEELRRALPSCVILYNSDPPGSHREALR